MEALENRELLSATVSVTATPQTPLSDGFWETSGSGSFTFTRTGGDTSDSLEVRFSIDDYDAEMGNFGDSGCDTDYYLSADSGCFSNLSTGTNYLSFDANETSVTLTITGLEDDYYEGHRDEKVKITLLADEDTGCDGEANYTVGTNGEATLTIADDDSEPEVSFGHHKNAAEGGQDGYFEIIMTGEFEGEIAVEYELPQGFGDRAVIETDYSQPSTPDSDVFSLVFYGSDASQQTQHIAIATIADEGFYEDDENLERVDLLILTANVHYTAAETSATIWIVDNDDKLGGNCEPVFQYTSYEFTLAANSSANTTVGTVTGLDGDGDTLTYAFDGNHDGFLIDSQTGAITTDVSSAVLHTAAYYLGHDYVDLTVKVWDASNSNDPYAVNVRVYIL